MKQPKFKFGDKVIKQKWDSHLQTISMVEYKIVNSDGTGEFLYNGGWWESEMELFQEPKAKKLYAYRGKDFAIVLSDYCNRPMQRVPEFDIEYPVKVTQDNEKVARSNDA